MVGGETYDQRPRRRGGSWEESLLKKREGREGGSLSRGSRAHRTCSITPTWLLNSSAQYAMCLGWGPQHSGS